MVKVTGAAINNIKIEFQERILSGEKLYVRLTMELC